MKKLKLIFFTILPLAFLAQKGVNIAALQGSWINYGISPDKANCKSLPEEYTAHSMATGDWHIKADTVLILTYPCQLYHKCFISIRNDSIYINSKSKPYCHIKASPDSITLTFNDCSLECFKKDSFSVRTIATLKRDTFNALCLKGKLNLIPKIDTNDETSNELIASVKMPKTIILSHKDAAFIVKKRQIMISLDGKKKRFNVKRIGFNRLKYVRSFIVLSPHKWWKGKEFEIRYEAE